MHKRPIIALAIAMCVLPFAVSAQSESFPKISGELAVEVENDWTYESDDRTKQNNNLYTTVEPTVTVQFTPSLSLFAHAVLEPVRDPEQFENRAFEDHGLFLEDLYLNYEKGPFRVKAGKLNVGFGIAWDLTPGVFGTDFAEDGYETSERLGSIASWTFNPEALGEHRLSAGTFFRDTTVFSESTLRGRGDTKKEDGGVSNTEDFSSFIFALDGSKLPGMGNLAYHVAYMHQGRGETENAGEDAVALALYSEFAVTNDVTVTPLVEFVHQRDAAGVAGQDRNFLTLGAQAIWHGFNLAVAGTGRDTEGTNDQSDFQVQISAGYAFDFGLTLDIGWKIAEEENVETRTLGVVAAYTVSF